MGNKMRPIGLKERLTIIKRHKAGDLSLKETWGLINRSLAHPSSRDFTSVLASFFNTRNAELDRLEASEIIDTC